MTVIKNNILLYLNNICDLKICTFLEKFQFNILYIIDDVNTSNV